MSEQPGFGDLQVREDPAFERRMFLIRIVSWGVMALIILAALLGLFGGGPLGQSSVGAEGGPLRIELDRFPRLQAPQRLRVRIGPGASRGGKARLWISADYLGRVELVRIEPPPQATEVGPDGHTFTFAVADAEGPATVVFHLVPEWAGPLTGRAALDGGEELAFRQFVYP